MNVVVKWWTFIQKIRSHTQKCTLQINSFIMIWNKKALLEKNISVGLRYGNGSQIHMLPSSSVHWMGMSIDYDGVKNLENLSVGRLKPLLGRIFLLWSTVGGYACDIIFSEWKLDEMKKESTKNGHGFESFFWCLRRNGWNFSWNEYNTRYASITWDEDLFWVSSKVHEGLLIFFWLNIKIWQICFEK